MAFKSRSKFNVLDNEKGVAFILVVIAAILVGIAAALLLSFFAADRTALATSCQTNLATLQTYHTQWLTACKSGSPGTSLCNQMNSLINDYNNKGKCGVTFGKLPNVSCTCPPQQE